MKLPFVLLLGCLCGLIACGGNSETGTNQPPVPSASMAITSTAPPSGAAGLPYGGTGFLLSAAGGMAPYHWQWAAASTSSLPQGMSISTEGLLSGTPTLPGTYTVIVTVVDAESPAVQVSARYTISITGPPALAITSGTPPSGTMGVEYGPERIENFSCVWSPILGWHLACVPCSAASCAALPPCSSQIFSPRRCWLTKHVFLGFTFTAGGGLTPYTWTATGLPDQLSLDASTGELKGTPSAVGSYRVTITVTDSQATPVQASADYVIDIAEPPAAGP